MIPMVMKLRIHDGRFRMCLWIPLFLLWLFLSAVALLLLPFIAIFWVVAAVRGFWIPLLRIGAAFVELLGSLSKTEIHFSNPASKSEIEIRVF